MVHVRFSQGGQGYVTEPLSDAELDMLRMSEFMTLVPYGFAEPGEFNTARYNLAGFSEGLDALDCPVRTALPRLDLTGQGTWQGGDIGSALPRDARGNAVPYPIASFITGDPRLPGLSVDCTGVPFFAGGDFGARPDVTLELTLDSDPGQVWQSRYGAYRSFLNPGGDIDGLAEALLQAETLRVLSVDNPADDILFPLAGMRASLEAAGC